MTENIWGIYIIVNVQKLVTRYEALTSANNSNQISPPDQYAPEWIFMIHIISLEEFLMSLKITNHHYHSRYQSIAIPPVVVQKSLPSDSDQIQ